MTELEVYIKSYLGITRPDDLQLLMEKFKLTTMKKGEYFLKTGRYCDKLSFVQSGLIRVYALSDDREVTQWISSKGFFVTDLASLVFNVPARWTIQTLSDVELYTISKEDYHNLKHHVPQWPELEKLFIAKCFTMLEDRIFSHLSMSAEERYQLLFEQQPDLFNQVPLQYLASMLGMTPETFSRVRKKMME